MSAIGGERSEGVDSKRGKGSTITPADRPIETFLYQEN